MPYNMRVRSAVCTAHTLLLLTILVLHHAWHCSAYLRTICRLLSSTPLRLLLTELGLLPLQVFWWRQLEALQFWNDLAVLPVNSVYHTVCSDNLTDAFPGVLAKSLAHWQHDCI